MNLKMFLCVAIVLCISIATKAQPPGQCDCSQYTDGNGFPLILDPSSTYCASSTCPGTDFDGSNECCIIDPNAGNNVPVNFHTGWLIAIAGLLLATFYFAEKYKVQK